MYGGDDVGIILGAYGEENILGGKVRSDLTEVAKLVYEQMKLVPETPAALSGPDLHEPTVRSRPRDFRLRLQLRLRTHREGDQSSEPSDHRMVRGTKTFDFDCSFDFRRTETETCLRGHRVVEWALGVQYMALGVFGFGSSNAGATTGPANLTGQLDVNNPSTATAENDPSGAVRNGWYAQRYEPEFISGCGKDCSACGGREERPKHKASKVAERRFIRNVSRDREGRLAF
jgi:hypothetical protein